MHYNDELYHYGVLGMKWGVRRSASALRRASASGNSDAYNKAIGKLQGHRAKINKKISKLDSKYNKLSAKRSKQIRSSDTRAAGMKLKASKLEKKSYGVFVSERRADRMRQKAIKLELKANVLIAKSRKTQAKIEKNRAITDMYSKGLSQVDQLLMSSGQEFLHGKR